jgi:hypothetical protein
LPANSGIRAIMIPVGYMAKKVIKKPDWLNADVVLDVYSVANCLSKDFADYIKYWKHNGYWFFDSPDIIGNLSKENSLDLQGTKLFYYEVYEFEFHDDENLWHSFEPEDSFQTNVVVPNNKFLEGHDIVMFSVGTSPECSPLSCNSLASMIQTNYHCLLDSFEEAKQSLERGHFNNSEPGPFRIFVVYSLESRVPKASRPGASTVS